MKFRKAFKKNAGKQTLPLSPLFSALGRNEKTEEDIHDLKEVEYYKGLADKKIQCQVCPRYCIINPGETCFCLTRKNHGGKLYSHAFNKPCKIIPDDPIEKLPLHHFYPGSKTLSIATGGCNLRCLYCQNWQISQSKPEELKNFRLSPQDTLEGANSASVKTIAFTYTEPMAFLEYAKAIAQHTHPKGIKNVVATSLFIEEKPLVDFCKYVDAFSVDLKGFTETFYREVCGISLKPVLDRMITLKQLGVWFEIVILLIPHYNNSDKEITEMCKWTKKYLGDKVPVYFSRFVPLYKLRNYPQTSIQDIERACEIALAEGIQFVYSGNVAPHKYNNTYCPNCKKVILERLGFETFSNYLKKNRCGYCDVEIAGIF